MEKMKIATIGSDFVTVDEDNIRSYTDIPKVHLIKLMFKEPTREKVEEVLRCYPRTNRFVVEDNIRFYNSILKYTNKKYYVENDRDFGIVTFFRKNNKVLLNFNKLSQETVRFLLSNYLEDVLRNVEVVIITQQIFDAHREIFLLWTGNVIIDG
jgi:hypothetical protein